MSQPLRHQIKQTLLTLNQFITKLSKPKQLQYSMEIKNLLKVKDPESEKTLQTVLKNLEYKYNFLRLTNPQISKMLEKANSAGIQSKSAEGKEGESEESLIPSDLEYNMQSESFMEETTQGEESKLKTGNQIFYGK